MYSVFRRRRALRSQVVLGLQVHLAIFPLLLPTELFMSLLLTGNPHGLRLLRPASVSFSLLPGGTTRTPSHYQPLRHE
ncbi:MAG: hypothetical protein ABIZ05_11505 [Pseudonocardiaceae bacterium]